MSIGGAQRAADKPFPPHRQSTTFALWQASGNLASESAPEFPLQVGASHNVGVQGLAARSGGEARGGEGGGKEEGVKTCVSKTCWSVVSRKKSARSPKWGGSHKRLDHNFVGDLCGIRKS